MFGLERRMGFIRSLVTDRASQFSEAVTRNISRAGEMVGRVTERATESVGNIAGRVTERATESVGDITRRVPDMILPEDTGSVGEQIMGEVREAAQPAIRQGLDQIRETASGVASTAQAAAQRVSEITEQTRPRELLPTGEIMRRKLNHFQIERLAEQIKERLESEIKVERERRGEEP